MSVKKLLIHLLIFAYLCIGIMHQVYYDDAYKILGIKGSITFARIWPIVGFILLALLWAVWAIGSFKLKRKIRKAKQQINHMEPIVESHQRGDTPASDEDLEYVRED